MLTLAWEKKNSLPQNINYNKLKTERQLKDNFDINYNIA